MHLRPSFFIIGERKCGTSSLFRYLLEHPQVLPGERKEMQFFSQAPNKVAEQFDTYLRRFPAKEGLEPRFLLWPELDDRGQLFEEAIEYRRESGMDYVTGEASADTFAEVPPELLQHYLPNLRLIVLLRDPVSRAFSHHRMLQRFQEEGRDMPSRIGDFADDMRSQMSAARSGNLRQNSLLSLGCYVNTLMKWSTVWGRESLLVLFTEDLENPSAQPTLLEQLRRHLGLSEWPQRSSPLPRYNVAPLARIPHDIQRELEDFYCPHNRRLKEFLQCRLPWEANQ